MANPDGTSQARGGMLRHLASRRWPRCHLHRVTPRDDKGFTGEYHAS
jgi:hypothetical protein|tara:strand:+ start:745 stop:885 length:141 start_codon:yes stop_codon:yes gene_type:complete